MWLQMSLSHLVPAVGRGLDPRHPCSALPCLQLQCCVYWLPLKYSLYGLCVLEYVLIDVYWHVRMSKHISGLAWKSWQVGIQHAVLWMWTVLYLIHSVANGLLDWSRFRVLGWCIVYSKVLWSGDQTHMAAAECWEIVIQSRGKW